MKVEQLAEALWRYEADAPYLEGEVVPDTGDYPFSQLEQWSREPHDGDCTGVEKPCCRCFAEQLLHKARWLVEQRLNGGESRELAELRCRNDWLTRNRDSWMRHGLRGGRPLTPSEKLDAASVALLHAIDQALQCYADGQDQVGREALQHAREVVLELSSVTK